MPSKKKSIVDNKSIRRKAEPELKGEKCEQLKKNNAIYRDCHCENCGFDLKKLKVLTEKGEFSTCKKYLENNPHILLKWYQINTEQGGDNVAQWIAWTEMSLNEIDMYNY